jgi:hypothetical protein
MYVYTICIRASRVRSREEQEGTPMHTIDGTASWAHGSVGLVRRPVRTDWKSVGSGCIRGEPVSRRRDRVSVCRLGATGGLGWSGGSRPGGPG